MKPRLFTKKSHPTFAEWRLRAFWYGLLLVAVVVVFRLGWLQIVRHDFFAGLAANQHEVTQALPAERGSIYLQDTRQSPDDEPSLVPLATNQQFYLIYGQTFAVEDPVGTAAELNTVLDLPPEVVARISQQLARPDDPYEPLVHRVTEDKITALATLQLPGIHWEPEAQRYYPAGVSGSHIAGFVGWQGDELVGQYGLEGYWNEELAGMAGTRVIERDAAGRPIGIGTRVEQPAVNGSNIVLTVDATLEETICRKLDEAVVKYAATGGTIIVMEPSTGAVRAMCGHPDYDPNAYSQVTDARAYTNPSIFDAYEPGSVFKGITMAAGLDTDAVTPETTYEDTGEDKIGGFSIRNFDDQAYGTQNMIEVLKQSLNLGAIFVMRQTGQNTFRDYVEKFGFGQPTGIELAGEVGGSLASLTKSGEVYSATAAFGQGITTTPLQLITAYSALVNGGLLMKPYIVDRVIGPDEVVTKTKPTIVRRVISTKTSSLIAGMLAEVVRTGHSTRAQVPGYYLGGKTGTAQIASSGGGYGNQTMQTFIGFGPVSHPVFVMLIRFDRPANSRFADGSAVPVFRELAEFILNYYQIKPDEITTQR
ncbi:MAG: penicillin-binding protein 2 [Patescibacteria group bacterium]